MNILEQTEPELAEMERCIKVITARIKQFQPRLSKVQEVQDTLLMSMSTINVAMPIMRNALMALAADERLSDDKI